LVIYRRTPGTDLEQIHEFAEGCWVSLVDPTPAEIEEIHQKLAIPQDFITSSLDLGEIPRQARDDPTGGESDCFTPLGFAMTPILKS